ncbi:hypothetical protein ARMGADRAFT_941021 [Armillaria gallica]|uniref:Uncharacterized protein n=1 Tax=Armillaria gallica TaxID=47427 RepID=A0A2H3CSS2_ARMGA|nr:hypothetical protein ARMGADRAFT_941021 [Armillaria gallica]
MLKQFDIAKKKNDATMSEAEKALQELADDIDVEELETHLQEVEDKQGGEKDDEDSLVDELVAMSVEECKAWEEQVRPAKAILVKLCRLSFKIIKSSTILLPAWYAILNKLKLKQRMLLHDVSTRWNSMYDMLVMALEYKRAVKQITSDDEEIGD